MGARYWDSLHHSVAFLLVTLCYHIKMTTTVHSWVTVFFNKTARKALFVVTVVMFKTFSNNDSMSLSRKHYSGAVLRSCKAILQQPLSVSRSCFSGRERQDKDIIVLPAQFDWQVIPGKHTAISAKHQRFSQNQTRRDVTGDRFKSSLWCHGAPLMWVLYVRGIARL